MEFRGFYTCRSCHTKLHEGGTAIASNEDIADLPKFDGFCEICAKPLKLSAVGDRNLYNMHYKVFLQLPYLPNHIKAAADILEISETQANELLGGRKEPFLLCEGNAAVAYFCTEKLADCVWTCEPEFPFRVFVEMVCEVCKGEVVERTDGAAVGLYCETCRDWAFRRL